MSYEPQLDLMKGETLKKLYKMLVHILFLHIYIYDIKVWGIIQLFPTEKYVPSPTEKCVSDF